MNFENLSKKLVLGCAVIGLAASAFATGTIVVNTPQSGVIGFSTNGSAYTNTFQPSFTYPPAMSVFLANGPTSALPFTNTVTATNFILWISTPTNCTVAWTAVPVFTQIQWGSQAVKQATPTNITFSVPFVYPPSLSGDSSLTNAATGISGVTTTNFTITVSADATVYWQAMGYTATSAQTGPSGLDGVVTH